MHSKFFYIFLRIISSSIIMAIQGEIPTETQEKSGKIVFQDEENRGEEKAVQKVIIEEEQSSPRGVLSPNSTNYCSSNFGGSDSSSSSSSSNSSEKVPTTKKENHGLIWKNLVEQVKKRSLMKISNIPFLGGYEFSKKSMRRKLGRMRSAEENVENGDFVMTKPSWRSFTYQELVVATDNFSSDKLVGQGGHAKVYRGCLADGQMVAVKKITKTDKNDEDRVAEFLSELGIIAHINNTNTAKLIGFSIDGGLHLVLQFIHHGSLSTVLHGATEPLAWTIRYQVAVGVAEGLHYLHYECQRRIIHRDITASNILLTQDYQPQISDFGLAKWLPEKWAHHVVSPIEGTFGYMAPEYFMHGIVHEKTDVFAFGVLLLEIITGRRAVDSCRQSLVMWAKPFLEQKNAKEIADPRLGDEYDKIEMKRVMATASACLHHLPTTRPTMIKVVQFLKGENEAIDLKTRSSGGRALFVDSCDLEDYTCTTYLNDLNRHMQLAME